jgi:ATP-dependent DNA helicase RecG
VRAVLDELVHGHTRAGRGFKMRHEYPERMVKEATVNAVIHRDNRLNRDSVIRIFDDRITVESPGALPGTSTPANSLKIRFLGASHHPEPQRHES